MRKIDLIIIHCSATPEGKDFRTADIDRWHRQQGFKSIGIISWCIEMAACMLEDQ